MGCWKSRAQRSIGGYRVKLGVERKSDVSRQFVFDEETECGKHHRTLVLCLET